MNESQMQGFPCTAYVQHRKCPSVCPSVVAPIPPVLALPLDHQFAPRSSKRPLPRGATQFGQVRVGPLETPAPVTDPCCPQPACRLGAAPAGGAALKHNRMTRG